MANSIKDHSGNKYIRKIQSCVNSAHTNVDVYAVLVAFNVTCPAVAHAIKKLLCAGIRNKGSRKQDLQEAIDALHRAIEMEEDDGTESIHDTRT